MRNTLGRKQLRALHNRLLTTVAHLLSTPNGVLFGLEITGEKPDWCRRMVMRPRNATPSRVDASAAHYVAVAGVCHLAP
jgi:hypothetical protein